MRVYLIAAPEDREVGEALGAFLKQYGVFIRSDYGELAYPPAQHGEMTLALWSRAAMMSTRQMMLTNRAIDAWSEGLLVMARLEHGLNPRGLADLDMVDLTFAAIREQRYRDVLNALRALDDARRAAARPPALDVHDEAQAQSPQQAGDVSEIAAQKQAVPRSGASVGAGLPGNAADAGTWRDSADARPPAAAANRMETAPATSAGGLGWLLRFAILVATAGALGWAIWAGHLTWQRGAVVGAGVLAAVIIIGAIAAFLLSPPASRSEGSPNKRASHTVARHEAGRRPGPADARTAAPAPSLALPEQPGTETDPDIFVSYAHQNADTVLPMVSHVEQSGLRVWIDRDDIRAGDMWAGMIVRAIKASGRFCLMCSEAAFASNHVRREVYLADKYGKDMLPIRLDSADMPEDIEYFLIGRQWIDLTELSDEDKVAALRRVLDAPAES